MRRFPPREPPPERRLRRDIPRPEGPFDRLLRRRPERDPAPLIIGGTIAFLALVIVLVLAFSALFGRGGDGLTVGETDGIDVAPGIRATRVPMPALPPGLVALSPYYELEARQDTAVTIGLPVEPEAAQDPAGLGFYTHFNNRWQRLADVSLLDIEGARIAEGEFSSVPRNLAVLRVLGQIYQVAGSLPHNGSPHAEARLNIVSPRDYTPAGDGTVQGQATQLALADALVMPTIIGSGTDTAAIVNDILDDETLRARHIQEITSLVEAGDFAGIDLEYSSVSPNLASQFTSFASGLADELHRNNRRLSLTLPPPSNQRQAYEWERLGEIADVIKILPIADPITYWEAMPNSLSRLIEDVHPGKVMLVLNPFSIEGAGDVSRPIGYQQAMALAAEAVIREPNPADIEAGTTVKIVARNLDEGEGASPLRWNDDAAAVSFALGGAERRRIFVENSFSAGFKLELVQAYHLGGLAVADASAQSDVANLWPAVNEFVRAATISLLRPHESSLQPTWQADGGELGAGAGTTVTWVANDAGNYNITLIVSDGERRFGRQLNIEVKPGDDEPSPTPVITFPPEEEIPTPEPEPVETPTPTPAASVLAEIGMRVDGDGDGNFTNDETVQPEAPLLYLVLIDNDSNVPVTIVSLVDDTYGNIVCSEGDVVGTTLAADDGDGIGSFDGGPDESQCVFTATAPLESGEVVTNTITVVVQDAEGNADADSDDATIRTS
jgi:hypothetical protein